MQCDFDLDFEMPWYGNGELYDTLTPVAGKSTGHEYWDELANFAKKSALHVFETFGEPDEESED